LVAFRGRLGDQLRVVAGTQRTRTLTVNAAVAAIAFLLGQTTPR
jgi:hypothetical protein